MKTPLRATIFALTIMSATGLILFVIGMILNRRLTHWYLFWNLFLAWIPLGFSVIASHYRHNKWVVWPMLALWLLFLPNTFYMITDYIHVTEVPRIDPVFDTVMFSTIIATGYILGIVSMINVHERFLITRKPDTQWLIIGAIAAVASVAIYLGRELRWNSWDMIYRPFHILHDIVMIIAHPIVHAGALLMSAAFFILILASYWACWSVVTTTRIK